jgi:serine/threonine protein kinase
LVLGTDPFNEATPYDFFYKTLVEDSIAFWAIFDPKDLLSKDFKNLVEAMLHVDPTKRLTLDEVLNHPWLKGLFATYEEVRQELLRRRR